MVGKAHPGGEKGECLAVRFLRRRGYRIVERNYRCRYGEIDLVALDGDEIVFVEVKTRSSTAFGSPTEAVTYTKRRRLAQAARDYCNRRHLADPSCRCDVVAILVPAGGKPEIELFRDAFPLA